MPGVDDQFPLPEDEYRRRQDALTRADEAEVRRLTEEIKRAEAAAPSSPQPGADWLAGQIDRVGGAVFHKLAVEVADNVEAHGFGDDRPFGDDIALLHSEVSEAYESWRKRGTSITTVHGTEQGCYTMGDIPENLLESVPCCRPGEPHKREGVAPELAGLFIRLLDTCNRLGVDLYAEYRLEMAYNRTRPFRHGGRRV